MPRVTTKTTNFGRWLWYHVKPGGNSTNWIVYCIKMEHEYIDGEGDYWASSPSFSSSSNSLYLPIYNIYMDLPNPKD